MRMPGMKWPKFFGRHFAAEFWARASVFSLASLALFSFLGRGALRNWDEAMYAEVSRQIIERHTWLTLYFAGDPYFAKPPLTFWVRSIFFELFRPSEFWARFESASAAVLVVFLTYECGKRLFGVRAGFLSACLLLATIGFLEISRQGMTEAPLCLCIYLAVYAYLRFCDGDIRWFYVICAAVGFGVMVKGPAVFVAPLAIGLDLLITRPRARLNARDFCLGAVLFFLIAGWWHLIMLFRYGRDFYGPYFFYHIVARMARPLEGNIGGRFFYLETLAHHSFPWSFVALVSTVWQIKRREFRGSVFWVLIAVTLVLYSLVSTKIDWYIFPVYPAIALEAGLLLSKIRGPRFLRFGVIGMVLLVDFLIVARTIRRGCDGRTGEEANLARMAAGSNTSEPLLVITNDDSDPFPTAIYYSHRPVRVLVLPPDADRLKNELAGAGRLDVILEKSAEKELALTEGGRFRTKVDGKYFSEVVLDAR